MTDLSNIGREFGLSHLEESDLKANPVEQFEAWINEAIQSNIKDPNAMALSTVDKSGRVTSRILYQLPKPKGYSPFRTPSSCSFRLVARL
jgi:pyridoxine/pyridoxamine 5'-phosphate oxidase